VLSETASGPVTVFSMQGTEVGHGWGEVKYGRGQDGHRPSTIGAVRRMTWLATLPPAADPQVYRIAFFGGPAFHGVFEPGTPDCARDHATFTPTNRPGDRTRDDRGL
jgi:hypothetical protein